MILVEDRQVIAARIEQAHAKGARLAKACGLAGITVRTLQRWKSADGLRLGDRRPHALRSAPAHALSAQERERLLQVANEPRFAELPPARIVPMLADEGVYLRGGLGISDRGVSGFLPVQYSNRRTEIHEETKTQSLTGVQSASGPGGDPG